MVFTPYITNGIFKKNSDSALIFVCCGSIVHPLTPPMGNEKAPA